MTNPRIWIEICNGGFIVQTTDERRDQNKRVHASVESTAADVESRLRTYATLARIGIENLVAGREEDPP
mgnify:CR=1 FL=1